MRSLSHPALAIRRPAARPSSREGYFRFGLVLHGFLTGLSHPACRRVLRLAALLGLALLVSAWAEDFTLRPSVQVTGDGIFLHQLFADDQAGVPGDVRVADAPAFGRTLILRRDQVLPALARALGQNTTPKLVGAGGVLVARRGRDFAESELLPLLTDTLQREQVRDKGDLELRLVRPWKTVLVPDEPFELRVTDIPATGLGASTVLRFEVRVRTETAGAWQVAVQARVMREIWVSSRALKRGESLVAADLTRERRDVLSVREPLADLEAAGEWEAADFVPAGAPVLARLLRGKAAVHRGQFVEALVQDGPLRVSMRVEAVEDGAVGEVVRLRNPSSRKELKGKVQDEKTVVVSF